MKNFRRVLADFCITTVIFLIASAVGIMIIYVFCALLDLVYRFFSGV